jgi:hypothetical protein
MHTRRRNVVTLECEGRKQDFEINHAERILRMKNNGGWKLPEDSNLKLDRANGLVSKRNKRDIKKA